MTLKSGNPTLEDGAEQATRSCAAIVLFVLAAFGFLGLYGIFT
jgi:hypothetical protein